MDERWAPMPGATRYQVSSIGRVRSPRGALLTAKPNFKGYPKIRVTGDEGKSCSVFVHVKMLEAFIGLTNLTWGTPAENYNDRRRHGTDNSGTRHPRTHLTDEKVREIRLRHRNGEGVRALAREVGISHSSIGRIVHRVTWKEVLDQ